MKRRDRIAYALTMVRRSIEQLESRKHDRDLLLGQLKEAELSLEKAERKE